MGNWKERAKEGLAKSEAKRIEEKIQRERFLRESREAEEQRRSIQALEERRLMSIGEARVRDFDALGIPGKLADINRDVWRNLGELKVTRSVVTPKVATRLISLTHIVLDAGDIEEDLKPIIALRFGRYSEARTEGSPMDGQYQVEEERFGLHDEVVGYRIVGWKRSKWGPAEQLMVGYLTELQSDRIQVGIYAGETTLSSPVDLKEGWKVTRISWHSRCFGIGTPNTDHTVHTTGKGIEVSLPESNYDPQLLTRIIDDAFLESCVGVLPRIDQWVRQKTEVDIKIGDIQSRIGQKVKSH